MGRMGRMASSVNACKPVPGRRLAPSRPRIRRRSVRNRDAPVPRNTASSSSGEASSGESATDGRGPREEKALTEGHAQFLKGQPLGFGLDTLGDDRASASRVRQAVSHGPVGGWLARPAAE